MPAACIFTISCLWYISKCLVCGVLLCSRACLPVCNWKSGTPLHVMSVYPRKVRSNQYVTVLLRHKRGDMWENLCARIYIYSYVYSPMACTTCNTLTSRAKFFVIKNRLRNTPVFVARHKKSISTSSFRLKVTIVDLSSDVGPWKWKRCVAVKLSKIQCLNYQKRTSC